MNGAALRTLVICLLPRACNCTPPEGTLSTRQGSPGGDCPPTERIPCRTQVRLPKKTACSLLYLISHSVGTAEIVGDDQPVLAGVAGEEMVLPGRGGSNKDAVLVPEEARGLGAGLGDQRDALVFGRRVPPHAVRSGRGRRH